ncbi:Holin of 3TMs, for gene-transfer release [uncultured Caudovirales phage]|uniref:Holin of 3TMs, for gene-transfer release n=1 Tax=uncultured Caudovirales phage TaxID=2100421 RepID=A0A6J7WX17_9CAUD|nr:Holin of 3TMs, for gene-transfer release [uncultured Caudovirales phage]
MNPLLISGLFSAAQSLIGRFFPDPEKQAEAQRALLQMQQNGELALLASETDLAKLQIQTNVEEAKHANIFVSGWRPAVGWTCAAAFAYSYVLLPFAQFLVFTFGTSEMVGQLKLAPKLELSEMLPVLFGMLGLGGLRTVEKVKNVEGNR